jgi:hypothetical protein
MSTRPGKRGELPPSDLALEKIKRIKKKTGAALAPVGKKSEITR